MTNNGVNAEYFLHKIGKILMTSKDHKEFIFLEKPQMEIYG